MRKILTVLVLMAFVLTGCSSSKPASETTEGNQQDSTSSSQKIWYDTKDEEINNLLKQYYELTFNKKDFSKKDLKPFYLPSVKTEDYTGGTNQKSQLTDFKTIAIAKDKDKAIVQAEYSFDSNNETIPFTYKGSQVFFLEKYNNQWLIKTSSSEPIESTFGLNLSEEAKKQIADPKWVKLNNETLQNLGISDVQTVKVWTNFESGLVMKMRAFGKINNHIYYIESDYYDNKLSQIDILDLNYKEIQNGQKYFKLDLSKF